MVRITSIWPDNVLVKVSVTEFGMGVESVANHKDKVSLMFHTNSPAIRHKAGLLNLACFQDFKISLKPARLCACQEIRFIAIRNSFKRLVWKDSSFPGPNLKNRVDEGTKQAFIHYAVVFPA